MWHNTRIVAITYKMYQNFVKFFIPNLSHKGKSIKYLREEGESDESLRFISNVYSVYFSIQRLSCLKTFFIAYVLNGWPLIPSATNLHRSPLKNCVVTNLQFFFEIFSGTMEKYFLRIWTKAEKVEYISFLSCPNFFLFSCGHD